MEKCYCGYLTDDKMLLKSASGGMATAIAIDFIENGGIVYGVAYKEDFKGAEWLRVTDKGDLEFIQGTKYVKANPQLRGGGNIFDSVIQDMKSKKVLFIGLPCEVGALTHRCNRRGIINDNLLTVDLICQGPAPSKLLVEYIELLEQRYESKLVSLSTRSKNPDWKHLAFNAVFENGNVVNLKLQETEFWKAFCMMPIESCYSCKFKGDNHKADITIGDYWGLEETDERYNSMGVSVAVVHSEKGEIALKCLNGFIMREADVEHALNGNPRYSTSVIRTEEKIRYAKLYKKGGLQYAHKNMQSKIGILKKIWRKVISYILLKCL